MFYHHKHHGHVGIKKETWPFPKKDYLFSCLMLFLSLSLLHMFVVYYHFLVVLNDLLYNNLCFFCVVVSKHMSNNKIKLYIGSGASMFVNVVSCVACLSIMCCRTFGVKMHMLLVFCGCSKFVLYFWNQGFACTFCQTLAL